MPTTEEGAAILVVSCDAYQDLWYPFFHCFFKYWPDCPYPIYLGSNFASYKDARVIPLPIGNDVDYSSNLLKMLEGIDHEFILLWIEDRVLMAMVDTARIQHLVISAKNRNAGYVRFIPLWPYAVLKDSTEEIGEISRGHKYRISMTVALWKKEVLMKLLCPGESAWDIERQGSKRSNGLDEKFFSLSFLKKDTPPLSDLHLIMKGRLIRNTIDFLKRERIDTDLSSRHLQTMGSYLYFRAYVLFFDLVSYLQWKWQSFRNLWPFHKGILNGPSSK